MLYVRRSFAAMTVATLASTASPAFGDEPSAKATAHESADEPPSRELMGDDNAPPPPDPLGPDATIDRWCAVELEALADDVCTFAPSHEAPGKRTLVIFLHGVVKPDTSWQWAQQRGAARAAEKHGFTVIMPRGRIGIGPKGMESWWTWPTSATAQAQVEDQVVAEWDAARTTLETRSARPFERVWVFGFSNGAYYATSLAMRGRLSSAAANLHADGFATFAGGSGATYLQKAGRETKSRAPFFVAWGDKDPAHDDQVNLAKMLRGLDWPSKSEGAKRAGHAMTDKQVTDAVRFLDASPKRDLVAETTEKKPAAGAGARAPKQASPKQAPSKQASSKTSTRPKKGAH